MRAQVKALQARLPWVSTPLIVGAPMRIASGHALAVAVSEAGGVGFIGPGAETKDMRAELEGARSLLSKSKRLEPYHHESSQTSQTMPIGIGFQVWKDDHNLAVELMREYRPKIVWLYAPKDEKADLIKWSASIRQCLPDTQIWVQIGTVAEVRALIQQSPLPDAIIAQGSEAGGHGRKHDAIGVVTIVPEVVDLLKKEDLDIPVLAAGGIADGRGAAAALCLGASGIVMGTRFLTTHESNISHGYRQAIVDASDGGVSTTRTLLYNHLRGVFGWPDNYSPRVIINQTWVDHVNGAPFERLKELHDEALQKGDAGWGKDGRLVAYSGASVGLIHDIRSAGEVVDTTRQDVRTVLQELVSSVNE